MSRHEQWDELAAGYALDALEPADRAAFLAHLATCAQCQDALDQHALVAAQLGSLAGGEATPPPWSAIRAGIVDAEQSTPTTVVDLDRRRRRGAVFLSAAAAAVVVVAGVVAWQLTSGSDDTVRPLASTAACLQTTGCHVVPLRAQDRPVASVLHYRNSVSVVPDTMTTAPQGSEWALWQLPRLGAPRLLTTFTGRSARAQLLTPYDDTEAFAVSREPAGTTPQVPTVVVASGDVV